MPPYLQRKANPRCVWNSNKLLQGINIGPFFRPGRETLLAHLHELISAFGGGAAMVFGIDVLRPAVYNL